MRTHALLLLLLLAASILEAQIQVNSTGNIGLGTNATTTDKVTLSGKSYLNGYLGIGIAPSTSYRLALSGNSYFAGDTHLNGNLSVGTTPSTLYKLNLTGNSYLNGYVGIGTAPSTTYKLNVLGKSSLDGDTYITGNVGIGTAPDTYSKLKVLGNTNFVGYCNFDGSSTFNNAMVTINGPDHYGSVFSLMANSVSPGMVLSSSGTFSGDYVLKVYGDAYSYGVWDGSDMQLKRNIANLDGKLMLSKITNLSGKKYEFKTNEELEQIFKNSTSNENDDYHKPMNLPKGERYGFIAQEIEKEFPELVKTDPKTNLKAVNYEGMIPILLESIKEQQKMIIQLQDQISSISAAPQLDAASPSSKNLITPLDNSETIENTLYQNAPNPFTQSTTIGYYLKENTRSAKIGLYDMNGSQLRSVNVNGIGKGVIIIDAKQLKAGIYMYSLIVDGILVDTKRMVLTD